MDPNNSVIKRLWCTIVLLKFEKTSLDYPHLPPDLVLWVTKDVWAIEVDYSVFWNIFQGPEMLWVYELYKLSDIIFIFTWAKQVSKILYTNFSDKMAYTSSADPDQTAPKGEQNGEQHRHRYDCFWRSEYKWDMHTAQIQI